MVVFQLIINALETLPVVVEIGRGHYVMSSKGEVSVSYTRANT